jgi:hypothetical protein
MGESKRMTAHEAADEIRRDVMSSSTVTADTQHNMRFLHAVAEALNLPKDMPTLIHISNVLREKGITPAIDQYPKVGRDDDDNPLYHADGRLVVFQTEDEEKEYADADDDEKRAQLGYAVPKQQRKFGDPLLAGIQDGTTGTDRAAHATAHGGVDPRPVYEPSDYSAGDPNRHRDVRATSDVLYEPAPAPNQRDPRPPFTEEPGRDSPDRSRNNDPSRGAVTPSNPHSGMPSEYGDGAAPVPLSPPLPDGRRGAVESRDRGGYDPGNLSSENERGGGYVPRDSDRVPAETLDERNRQGGRERFNEPQPTQRPGEGTFDPNAGGATGKQGQQDRGR